MAEKEDAVLEVGAVEVQGEINVAAPDVAPTPEPPSGLTAQPSSPQSPAEVSAASALDAAAPEVDEFFVDRDNYVTQEGFFADARRNIWLVSGMNVFFEFYARCEGTSPCT
jgi:hypothetical protein